MSIRENETRTDAAPNEAATSGSLLNILVLAAGAAVFIAALFLWNDPPFGPARSQTVMTIGAVAVATLVVGIYGGRSRRGNVWGARVGVVLSILSLVIAAVMYR